MIRRPKRTVPLVPPGSRPKPPAKPPRIPKSRGPRPIGHGCSNVTFRSLPVMVSASAHLRPLACPFLPRREKDGRRTTIRRHGRSCTHAFRVVRVFRGSPTESNRETRGIRRSSPKCHGVTLSVWVGSPHPRKQVWRPALPDFRLRLRHPSDPRNRAACPLRSPIKCVRHTRGIKAPSIRGVWNRTSGNGFRRGPYCRLILPQASAPREWQQHLGHLRR